MNNDLISRSMVLLAIDRNISNMRKTANGDSMANKAIDLVQITRDFIANHPAAVELPGYWQNANGRPKSYIRKCSVCGKEAYFCGRGCSYKFCPNCGAKMDGGQK